MHIASVSSLIAQFVPSPAKGKAIFSHEILRTSSGKGSIAIDIMEQGGLEDEGKRREESG